MSVKDLLKIVAIQMLNTNDNDKNISIAIRYVEEAAKNGADIVVLPEMFSCPYKASNFPVYAQEDKGKNWIKLSKAAFENKIYLVAGSMPEFDNGKIYNTSYVFDRNGQQIAKHRKMHLFNCDYKNGGQVFHESDTLTAGNSVTTFETEFGTIGLMICFDIRFPELSRLMFQRGARLVIVPAAFNMTSGPRWWDLVFRMRATDNQIFFVGCSPARNENASYVAWGNSLVVNPFGEIIKQLDEKEGILYCNVDFSVISQMREECPVIKELRNDIYKVVDLTKQ